MHYSATSFTHWIVLCQPRWLWGILFNGFIVLPSVYAPVYVTWVLSWSSSDISNFSLRQYNASYQDYPCMSIFTIHLFLIPSRSSPQSGISGAVSRAVSLPSSLFLCPPLPTETQGI